MHLLNVINIFTEEFIQLSRHSCKCNRLSSGINEYISNSKGVCLVTDGVSSFQTADPAFLDTLTGLPKVNDSVIVPVEFYAYNTEKVTFTRTPDIFIVIMSEDSIVDIKWYNNHNFVNVLVTSDN